MNQVSVGMSDSYLKHGLNSNIFYFGELCSRQIVRLAITIFVGATAAIYGNAALAANVALISDGASFVSASSANVAATTSSVPNALTIMQDDVISSTPSAWLSNGETRYIFGAGDQTQSLEIELGSTENLRAFGALFDTIDRPVGGPFKVETSVDGIIWTQQGATVVHPVSGADIITLSTPVQANYVEYFFGPVPTGTQNGADGSGVSEVFANTSVPEPRTWALMLGGFGILGVAIRSRRTLLAI